MSTASPSSGWAARIALSSAASRESVRAGRGGRPPCSVTVRSYTSALPAAVRDGRIAADIAPFGLGSERRVDTVHSWHLLPNAGLAAPMSRPAVGRTVAGTLPVDTVH